MSLAVQTVQSAHAAIDFQYQHPAEATNWFKNSNYLALLTVKDEESLKDLIIKATMRGIKHTIFREPDLDNQITAIALEAGVSSQKLTSSLQLLGKEVQRA